MVLIGWETEVSSNAGQLAENLFAIGHRRPDSTYDDGECHCECRDGYDEDDYYECDCCSGYCDHNSEDTPGYHEYHCYCRFCEVYPNRPHMFHFQNDCTANGEIITKPVDPFASEVDQAVKDLCWAGVKANASTLGSVGNHVHVSRILDEDGHARLFQLWEAFQDTDIPLLAKGARVRVRNYNSPTKLYKAINHQMHVHFTAHGDEPRGFKHIRSVHYSEFRFSLVTWYDYINKGPWLSVRSQTFEFRVWNASLNPCRLRAYGLVSAAFVLAAEDDELDPLDPDLTFNHVLSYLGPREIAIVNKAYEHQRLLTPERIQQVNHTSRDGLYYDLVTEHRIDQATAETFGDDENIIKLSNMRAMDLV